MESAFLRFNGQPLSPAAGDAGGEPLRGDALAAGVYTIRHNARHKLRGHLFQGRYKAVLVDGRDDTYFRTVSDYIHLNPVRAGILGEGELLSGYCWSSLPQLVGDPRKRPAWLTAEWVLGAMGEKDSARGRCLYRAGLEKRLLKNAVMAR